MNNEVVVWLVWAGGSTLLVLALVLTWWSARKRG